MSILALGPAGTNGHEAADRLKKNNPLLQGHEIVFCKRNSEILEGVSNGKADYGVAPIENNSKGLISEAIKYWLKQDPDAEKRSIHVIGEIVIPIRHCLLAAAGTGLENIKWVESHTEALPQCAQNLARLNLNDQRPTLSTAAAAREVAENPEKHIAAIASGFAAEIYGLNILQKDMQDENDNATRFHLLGREPVGPEGHDRTAAIFWTKNVERALYNALGPIAMAHLNMTSMHSIPLGKNESYAFYVEFEGHHKDPLAAAALTMLRENHTEKMIVLGGYPRANGNSVTRSTYPPSAGK